MPQLLLALFQARPAGLGWANLAEGRLRLDRLPATAAARLFPLPGHPARSAGTPTDGIPRARQKVSGLPSSAALRPFGL
ncbi:MAG: hypothetical protein WAU59_11160, partial [Rhodoplanes sp.]